MSQNKVSSKKEKNIPNVSKSKPGKKTYNCYYCSRETKNSDEICSYCQEYEQEFEENSEYNRLLSARIPLKNLVYIIGLAPELAKEDLLGSYEYLGQYGKIKKLVVNKMKSQRQNSTFSAYVTFSNEKEASLAIFALDETQLYSKTMRAFFGTTKYCTFFLKDQKCMNEDCVYLHEYIKDESSLNPENEGKKLTLHSLLPYLEDYKKNYKPKSTAVLPNASTIIKNLEKLFESSQKSDIKAKKNEKTTNKPLDIISIDEIKENKETLEKLEINSEISDKNIKCEENDKKRKNGKHINTKPKEYHSEANSNKSNEESDDNDYQKNRRKTLDHSDIEKLIIKSFISKEYGQNQKSRFGFAKNCENNNEEIKNLRKKIEISIQNFFRKWNNKHITFEESNLFFSLKDE